MTVEGKKRISGIEMKVSENIKNPQIWPQSVLQLSTCVSALSFNDLDFGTFVAGELEIITQANISPAEKSDRLELLKCLAYAMPDYEWERLRDIYFTFLRQIEVGSRSWGTKPRDIELEVIKKALLVPVQYREKASRNSKSAAYKYIDREPSRSRDNTPGNWFCSDFQRNKCKQSSPHPATIRGVPRQVQHFCATCFQKDKQVVNHPECSSACPNQ